MNAVILSQDQFDTIMNRIDEIKTAQSWRDEGKISFSQVAGKIYYKMSDIQDLLNHNYNPAFNKKK